MRIDVFYWTENSFAEKAVTFWLLGAVVDCLRFSNLAVAPFLNVFWFNSPTPDFHQQLNIGFWVIYALIFVALALQASGARMSRQTRFLREGVEDQLILEQAKGPEGMSREQIESRIVVPRHTIFLQIFPLYILPVIIIVAGYFFFSLLGFL